jgi:hypothetical protein
VVLTVDEMRPADGSSISIEVAGCFGVRALNWIRQQLVEYSFFTDGEACFSTEEYR